MLKTIKKCPACSSSKRKQIGLVDSKAIQSENIYLYKCEECGLFFKDKVLNAEFEIQTYKEWKSKKGARWTSKVFNDKSFANKINSLIYKHTNKNKINLLDIGGGEANYLKYFKANSISIFDILPEDRSISQRYQTYNKNIEEKTFNHSLTYNCITLFDVLEHLSDPETAFHNLHKILDKDGIIIIETGNSQSLLPRIFGVEKWWYTIISEHKIIWNLQSITNFIKSMGFSILYFEKKFHKKTKPLFSLRNWWLIIKYLFVFCKIKQPKIRSLDHFLIIIKKLN